MPYKEKTIEKLFWTIGEVAAELGLNTSQIRYWEKEFGTLRPKRTTKGDRLYTAKDIAELKRIHHLVKEQGFTLQGAREQLRKGSSAEAPRDRLDEVRDRLLDIRQRLLDLRNAC